VELVEQNECRVTLDIGVERVKGLKIPTTGFMDQLWINSLTLAGVHKYLTNYSILINETI
jgi:hypothetical protein